MYNAPVYTNTPIGSEDIDYVGLKSYANHIDVALSKSNVIGIIGDFGTGKSSLIEYLKNNNLKNKYQVASINMWGISKEKDLENGTNDNNINVHINFLYQLALCLTTQRTCKSINRRINPNYGLFSFDINMLSGFLFLLAASLYLLYIFFKPENAFWLECILDGTKAGAILCSSIFCLIIGIFKANITVSSGKNENKREINDNEIVEIYKDILKYRKWKSFSKWIHKKKVVIVIEDLDRSSDCEKAYAFLKELNKYYINSLDDNERGNVKFIVNIRPEKDFMKNSDPPIYSKIFDYTVNLFPINASNYDVILDNLLNEQKDNLDRLGIDVFPEKNTQKSRGMKRLVYGKEITIRDVKERLNTAILIYTSLRSKIADKTEENSIKFEICAFVAYLKNSYPADYLKIYKNNMFEDAIFEYVVNNKESEYSLEETLRKAFLGADERFIRDLKIGIKDRLIDVNYKMYFYNYPKNAYIRSINEAKVYDSIMYDEYDSNFDASLIEAIALDKDIISSTYEERRSLSPSSLPKVTFRNGLLFEYCIKNYNKETFENLKEILYFDSQRINNSKEVLENLFSLKSSNLCWGKLVSQYKEEFKNLFVEKLNNIEQKNVLIVRSIILDYFANQIDLFEYLFSEDYPPIQCEEIKRIPYINKGLALTLLQSIDLETVKTIHEIVMNDMMDDKTANLVNELYDNVAESINENEDVGIIFAEFSGKVERLSPQREAYIFDLAENSTTFREIYIKMLNKTNGEGADEEMIVNHIKELKITEGLEISLAYKLLRGKEEQLFISNLLSADYNINDIMDYKDILKKEISNVYTGDEDVNIGKLRSEILNAAKKNHNIINELDFAFKTPLHIITEDELDEVSRINDALRIIDCEQVDLNNYKYIAGYINRKGLGRADLVLKVFEIIENIKADVKKPFFQQLDFNKIAYERVSPSKRKAFINGIEENFGIASDKLEIIHFLKHINFLEKDLERRLIGKFTNEENKEYKLLLGQVKEEEIDNVTMEVLTESGFYSSHGTGVQKKLYEYEKFDRYIYAKTMNNRKFDFEKDNLECPIEAYKKLLKIGGLSSLYDLMFKNSEFSEYAIEKKMYLQVDDETLYYFAKGIQTKDLIEYLFTKEESVVKKYLTEIVAIENSDTEEFLVNKMLENHEILIDNLVHKNLMKRITDIDVKKKYKSKRAYRKKR